MHGKYAQGLALSVICFAFLATIPNRAAAQAKPLAYTGVNLAGGDFGAPKPDAPAVYGKNYVYPTQEEFDYFIAKGMNVFRMPFLWENLQPKLKQPFVAAELDRIKAAVLLGTRRNAVVLLDPHNYARYFGKVVGGPEVSADDFADFWARLATAFKDNQKVWFGLVNEPHDLPNEMWRQDANAAIAAIRKAGAKNLIVVPGNSWTGAHSWVSSGSGAETLKIVDPLNRYIFDVHQYLDADCSGQHPEPVSATIGSERLREFTKWCRDNRKRGFLGEFGSSSSDASKAALGDMLSYMEANSDVWVGFSWWAAGAWWGDYMYSIEPKDGQDKPQMAVLLPHLHGAKAK